MAEKEFNRDKLLKQKVIFCTECGAELENFCFSEKSRDPETVKKSLAQCKKSGKFKGEFCSKLFISHDMNLDSLWEEDEL